MSVPAKLMLAGEYTVLFESSPCLACTLNKSIVISTTLQKTHTINNNNIVELPSNLIRFIVSSTLWESPLIIKLMIADHQKNSIYKVIVENNYRDQNDNLVITSLKIIIDYALEHHYLNLKNYINQNYSIDIDIKSEFLVSYGIGSSSGLILGLILSIFEAFFHQA